jgi:hypothetical protein
MTPQTLQTRLPDIDRRVVNLHPSLASEKHFTDDIVMTKAHETTTTDQPICCQERAVFLDEILIERRESRLTRQDTPDSTDARYDVVVFNWYIDYII